MKDWKEYYNSRKCSADQAVREIVRSGDHVVFGHNASEPQALIDALIRNYRDFTDITIHHMQSMGAGEYTKPEYKDHFRFDGWFLSPGTRSCVAEGYGDTTPNHYYQTDQFFEKGIYRCDVALINMSPPDSRGYMSIGVSVDYTMAAVKHADRIIAQINRHVPVTHGDTAVHVSQVDRFVEADEPLKEFRLPPLSDKEKQIGEYCSSLIPDRATISLGVGSIPAAVSYSLHNKKDLGVFTDMFSDAVMDLFNDGIITNKYCTTDPDVMTTSFVVGSKDLYDFCDRNPKVNFRSATYCNHPLMIARQSNVCIVNSAVSIDLMGQIVSASIGEYQFSGVGGQPSLNLGAALSRDGKGKSIIAMTSSVTDFSGKLVSKITPFITRGSEVTLTREDTDYVITENGIASLKGKSLEDRSRELIRIADPQFRDELVEEFERRYRHPF